MSFRSIVVAPSLATLSVSCGRKEAPKPPPSKIPAPVAGLTLQQRGMEIVLRMSYPTTTLGGLPIDGLEAVEILQLARVAPTFQQVTDESAEPLDSDTEVSEPVSDETAVSVSEPEEGSLFRLPESEEEATETPEDLIQIDAREFAGLAKLRRTLSGAELDAAVLGDQLVVHLPIEELPEEDEVLVLGARAVAGKKLISPVSNLVKLLPRQPPPAPTSLSVEPGQKGVEISWESGPDVERVHVYRRDAQVREYGPPLYSAPPGSGSYLDASALFDQRYIYTVTTVASTDPIVESAIAAEREVDFQDRFPPDPPGDLVALAEEGRVRLLWETSTSEDVAGYRIYRQDPAAEFQSITPQLVVGSEYMDRDLPGGQTYAYFVVAVDGADNQSDASEPAEATVP